MRNILPLLIGVIVAGIVTYFVFDVLMQRIEEENEGTRRAAEERVATLARQAATTAADQALRRQLTQLRQELRRQRQEETNVLTAQWQRDIDEVREQVGRTNDGIERMRNETANSIQDLANALEARPQTVIQQVVQERLVRVLAFAEELRAGAQLDVDRHIKMIERPASSVAEGYILVPEGQSMDTYAQQLDNRYLKIDVLTDQPLTFNMTQPDDPSPRTQEMQAILANVLPTEAGAAPPPDLGEDPGEMEQLLREQEEEELALRAKPPTQRVTAAILSQDEVADVARRGINRIDIYEYNESLQEEWYTLEPLVRGVRLDRLEQVEGEGNSAKRVLTFYVDVGDRELANRIALARATTGIRVVAAGRPPIRRSEETVVLAGRVSVRVKSDPSTTDEVQLQGTETLDSGQDLYERRRQQQLQAMRERHQADVERLQAEARQNAVARQGEVQATETLILTPTGSAAGRATAPSVSSARESGSGVTVTSLSSAEEGDGEGAAALPSTVDLAPLDVDSLLAENDDGAPVGGQTGTSPVVVTDLEGGDNVGGQASPVLSLDDLLSADAE